DTDGDALCVRASPAPSAVTIWSAHSEDTDFRDERFAPQEALRVDDLFVFDVVPPDEGYKAIFAEALFEDALGSYMLSTNVRLFDADGEAPFEATALNGQPGICPHRR